MVRYLLRVLSQIGSYLLIAFNTRAGNRFLAQKIYQWFSAHDAAHDSQALDQRVDIRPVLQNSTLNQRCRLGVAARETDLPATHGMRLVEHNGNRRIRSQFNTTVRGVQVAERGEVQLDIRHRFGGRRLQEGDALEDVGDRPFSTRQKLRSYIKLLQYPLGEVVAGDFAFVNQLCQRMIAEIPTHAGQIENRFNTQWP